MAKKTGSRYAPGEFDRVRRNLGPLSPDESARMAELLGGDVGDEGWDPAIEAGYERLRGRAYVHAARNRPSTFRPRADDSSQEGEESQDQDRFPDLANTFHSRVAPYRRTVGSRRTARLRRPPYVERVRMDLIASRPQHGIKSRGAAIASFLSFVADVPDFVNPQFIMNLDRDIGVHVDALVTAVRLLADKNRKQLYHSLRKETLSFRILNVIREWDIEGLHRDFTYLQSRPRRLLVADLEEMTRRLYLPIVLLAHLDPLYHVTRAVRFAYQQHARTLPKSSPALERLRDRLRTAQQEIAVVFSTIKRRCYPLLMKLASNRCLDHGSYFIDERDSILRFLGIQESQLLRVPTEAEVPASAEDTPESDAEEPEAEETDSPDGDVSSSDEVPDAETPDIQAPEMEEDGVDGEEDATTPVSLRIPSGAVRKGLALLDRMFPQAGWLRLSEYPDFYAYFQPLLNLPRGYELLPPSDVLSPVAVLVALLRELFYAYREIRFGSITGEDGESVHLDELVDELLDSWHQYLDDILGGEYIQRLVDYCRQVERHRDFRSTRYALRVDAELAWIKAKHLVQWSELISASGLRIPMPGALPPLYERVDELKDILTRVALDIDKSKNAAEADRAKPNADGRSKAPRRARCASIENPWARATFQIHSSVSRRVTSVVAKITKSNSCSNASLIYATISLLYVLEYLLTNPTNPYTEVDLGLAPYRGVDGRGGEPAYVVNLRQTHTIIQTANDEEAAVDLDSFGGRDDVTGFRTGDSLREELRSAIRRYDSEKELFSIIGARIRNYDTYRERMGDRAADALAERFAGCVQRTVDPSAVSSFRIEDNRYLLLLLATQEEEAVARARKLFLDCIEQDPANLQLSLAVIPYYRTWGPERVVRAVFRSLELAQGHPYPTCLTFNAWKGTHEIIDLMEDAGTD